MQRKKKSKDQFWLGLAAVNAVVLAYPLSLYLRADNGLEQFIWTVALVGLGLLLAIVDTISIVVTYSH